MLMVLLVLGVGSAVIVPTLNSVGSGLVQMRVHQNFLEEQYAVDSAVEYISWQLKYDVDGIQEELTPGGDGVDDTINVNGIDVPVVTEITQSPVGEEWPFPVPIAESGIHLSTALAIQAPYWDGETAYFPHIVYVYNSGGATTHIKSIFQELDPRLTYVPDSYQGPDAELIMNYAENHWELSFDMDTPLPSLGAGEATFITFLTSTTEEVGEDAYEGEGVVYYAAFGSEEGEIFSGEYALSNIGAYYDITATAGSYTVLVNVGITEEGELIIRSYQVQQFTN